MDIRCLPLLFGLTEAESLSVLTAGHINTTYLAVCSNIKYILQALSSNVFQRPEAVMRNISCIESAFSKADSTDIAVPHFIDCGDKNYAEADGKLWRMYKYISASADASATAEAAGRAFGAFIRVMDGQSIAPEPVIDGFHDYDRYFAALAEKNQTDRSTLATIDKLRDSLGQIFTDSLKKRIIHGDAKPDNLIISEKTTIIDLDTVMYGYAAADYGDLVRSVCRGKELELSVISVVTNGFSHGLNGILNHDEVNSLYYGVLWLTGELAVRYLTDSQSDEKYFKGKSSAECLARAEELLHQLDMFDSHSGEIIDIIHSHME